jgi:hypothetical protein
MRIQRLRPKRVNCLNDDDDDDDDDDGTPAFREVHKAKLPLYPLYFN